MRSLRTTGWGTVGICFLAALMEGADTQSMGVALPRLAPAFGLNPSQAGLAAAAAVLGLLIGAGVGGWAADRLGRRKVLIGSMTALGVFSLLTTVAPNFEVLLWVRLLTGLGLGGAFPNLIALSGEAVPTSRRSTAIGLMYAGLPLGGAAASATGLLPGDWRPVFYLGGFGPLVVVAVMLFTLPESPLFQKAKAESAPRPPLASVLFGEGRALSTLLLWTGYFFTLLVLYLLLSWLPTLLIGKGLDRTTAFTANMLMNFGGALGAFVFGVLLDRGKGRSAAAAVYLGMALSLAALGALASAPALIAAAATAGFFVIGGQLILYALAPAYYPIRARATGLGAAIAAGRLGSLTGPLAAGAFLSGGASASAVLGATVPGMVAALAAIIIVQLRPRAQDA